MRPSTPTQRLLQILLDLPEPAYLHHPLVTHDDGRRLAKRDVAPTLEAMRAAGIDGPALAARLLEGRLPLRIPPVAGLDSCPMNTFLFILLLIAMGAVLYVLVRGVIAMANGKDVTGEVQQGYMQKRVLYQAVAIVIVILILAMAGGGRS